MLHRARRRSSSRSCSNPTRPAIHTALPQATADQREFLISGMLPDEFDDLMAELEEE